MPTTDELAAWLRDREFMYDTADDLALALMTQFDVNGSADLTIRLGQHCTYENQDGVDDYSFSHTAAYCGRPQPRRCGCPFCY